MASVERSARMSDARLRNVAEPGSVRPFLKWAGGKRQLLPQLRRFIPPGFDRYFEPFLGSGAFFLDLYSRGDIGSRSAVLADNNVDLIGCYAAVQHDVEKVIRELRKLEAGHRARGARHYYEVRDHRFNPLRRILLRRTLPHQVDYPAKLAAMFVYLNRTGYNGLYRLNASGDFNVPAGRYVNPQVCDAVNLRAIAATLRTAAVELREDSFESVLADCRRGDFLYIDPPYAPLTTTSNFTSYTAGGFADDDQRRLQEVILELAHRGCRLLLSNSAAPIITQLYDKNPKAHRAGLTAYRVAARRAINSNASRRGAIEEYIVTNIPPQ
jgi:DNA adenine methylase